MARRWLATQVRQDQAFKGGQFNAEVILSVVRWYLMLPISCLARDVANDPDEIAAGLGRLLNRVRA
jgi:hypothetical protein